MQRKKNPHVYYSKMVKESGLRLQGGGQIIFILFFLHSKIYLMTHMLCLQWEI